MAYYNHFAFEKYKAIPFSELKVGDKFRKDMFKNKRRRKDIIMIKTGERFYMEQKSKTKHTLGTENIYVASFDQLRTDQSINK